MGQPACLLAPAPVAQPARVYPIAAPKRSAPEFAFRSLVLTEPHPLAKHRSLTLAASIVIHGALLVAVVLLPLLLFEEIMPAPDLVVRGFFAAPAQLAPAPPPPPPPPAARTRVPAAAPVPPPQVGRFVAPLEIPEQMPVDEGIDMGVEGGVPGGVEGGVPGGVVGGIIGGLPVAEAPPPPRAVVRIGGDIRAPKLIHEVQPAYPVLAIQARLSGMVIMEAHVGTDGRVQSVRVVSGNPILDPAAIEAVKQRRYQPLLLNGVPTEFILTMTMVFRITTALPGS